MKLLSETYLRTKKSPLNFPSHQFSPGVDICTLHSAFWLQGQYWIEYLYLLLAAPPYMAAVYFVVITNGGGARSLEQPISTNSVPRAIFPRVAIRCRLSLKIDRNLEGSLSVATWDDTAWIGGIWHLVLRTYLWFWLCNALPVYLVGSALEITAVSVTVTVTVLVFKRVGLDSLVHVNCTRSVCSPPPVISRA